jgi:beta-galactosidase GanA
MLAPPPSVVALICLFFGIAPIGHAGSPRLERNGHATQLMVNNKPFLVLGGEVYNSSSSSRKYMSPIWRKLAAMHLNTVLIPVSWEQLEPREGTYDFSLLDGLVDDARTNGLHLGLLWFGTWKNMVSSYAPAWVRGDPKRFPCVIDEWGNRLPVMSPFSVAGQDADRRAFAALLTHLAETDYAAQTVILVQVENELGLPSATRDHSAAANRAFHARVPPELMAHLLSARNDLTREMSAVWSAAGGRSEGTWEEVFGDGPACNEIFMAWNYARYVSGVVATGHAAYQVPLFVNAAIGRLNGRIASYPGGGALPIVFDVWRAAAPQVEIFSPDIYYGSFADWCKNYTQSGNPLFIPETNCDDTAGANACLAFGGFNAIGFSPFGVDDEGPSTATYAEACGLLAQVGPSILEHQASGKMAAFKLMGDNSAQTIEVGGYLVTAQLRIDRHSGKVAADGYALIMADPGDRFTVCGKDVQITFSTRDGAATVALETVEEGSFANGEWMPSRRLNGDETMLDYDLSKLGASYQTGTGLKFGADRPSIQRVHLFTIN